MPVQFGLWMRSLSVMKAIKLLSSNDIVLPSVVIQMARKSSTLLSLRADVSYMLYKV